MPRILRAIACRLKRRAVLTTAAALNAALRFIDGLDEVPVRIVARAKVARAKQDLDATAPYCTLPDSR